MRERTTIALVCLLGAACGGHGAAPSPGVQPAPADPATVPPSSIQVDMRGTWTVTESAVDPNGTTLPTRFDPLGEKLVIDGDFMAVTVDAFAWFDDVHRLPEELAQWLFNQSFHVRNEGDGRFVVFAFAGSYPGLPPGAIGPGICHPQVTIEVGIAVAPISADQLVGQYFERTASNCWSEWMKVDFVATRDP